MEDQEIKIHPQQIYQNKLFYYRVYHKDSKAIISEFTSPTQFKVDDHFDIENENGNEISLGNLNMKILNYKITGIHPVIQDGGKLIFYLIVKSE